MKMIIALLAVAAFAFGCGLLGVAAREVPGWTGIDSDVEYQFDREVDFPFVISVN